jgi:hypothetical protein
MEDDLAEYDEYRQFLIGQKRKEQIQAFTAYDQSPPGLGGLSHQQIVRNIMGGAPQKKTQPATQQRRMNEDSDSV